MLLHFPFYFLLIPCLSCNSSLPLVITEIITDRIIHFLLMGMGMCLKILLPISCGLLGKDVVISSSHNFLQ